MKMAAKFLIRKRKNKILYLEFLLVAIAAAVLLVKYFELHPAYGLLIGIAFYFIFAVLFFANRIFRYLFSILFSTGWAFIAFAAGDSFDKNSDTTAWVFAILAFAISIWAHRDHFRFLKEAKVYEYGSR